MKLLLFFLMICFFGSLIGQDLKKDISVMNAHLGDLPVYRLDVEYTAGDTTDFFNEGFASVLVSEKGLFYQTDFASMIINSENTIIVNEEEKTLIYSDNEKTGSKKGTPLDNYILQGIDTLLRSADSVYFTLSDSKRIYHLRFSDAYFNLVEMTFEGTFLTKVVYFYNEDVSGEKGLTAVCKVHIEEAPIYQEKLLLTDFYFKKQNNKIYPTEQFTGYLLIYNESIESISN